MSIRNALKALVCVAQTAGSALVAPTARADISFAPPQTFAAGSLPVFVAVDDFNRDGVPDLAVANVSSNHVSVLLGNGDGSFRPARSFAAGRSPDSIAVGDFNGDGVPDLAVANDLSNDVSVLL